MNHQSEIAYLQQQIEAETAAMQQALYGYAAVAKHRIIAQRYQVINEAHQRLQDLVSKDQALAFVFTAYSRAMKDQ